MVCTLAPPLPGDGFTGLLPSSCRFALCILVLWGTRTSQIQTLPLQIAALLACFFLTNLGSQITGEPPQLLGVFLPQWQLPHHKVAIVIVKFQVL